jgi:glycosyltransferase involved in cell wall biosynthesis
MKFSVCIPTYEMEGKGVAFLNDALLSIKSQTVNDLEIVISDHSVDSKIEDFCAKEDLNIRYFRNTNKRGSSSVNINNAIQNSNGEIIKILFQDDYFYDPVCLEQVALKFEEGAKWVVVGTTHTSDGVHFYNPIIPRYHKKIYEGKNTISSPSVLAIRNESPLLFDEDLSWLMDVEYYKRLYDSYGLPSSIDNILIVNRLWKGQVSRTKITQDLIDKEVRYVRKKHS